VRCGSFSWAAASTSGPFGSAKRPWSGQQRKFPPTQIPAKKISRGSAAHPLLSFARLDRTIR